MGKMLTVNVLKNQGLIITWLSLWILARFRNYWRD